MRTKAHAARTINPLHFEDLEPHRFEDLVRQLAYDFRVWRVLEATGRLGADEGMDVRGIKIVSAINQESYEEESTEEAPIAEERVWVIQCKRYKTITPKVMRTIVVEAVAEQTPYGLIVATACDVTKATMDAFREEARAQNVQEFELWTKARLEDLLFQPRFDHLLFAYFNLSIAIRRRTRLMSVRHALGVKRKLRQAFDDQKFFNKAILVRDVENDDYPYEQEVSGFEQLKNPPWHLALAKTLYYSGLIIAREGFIGWVQPDKSWDMIDDGPNLLVNSLYQELGRDLRLRKIAAHNFEKTRELEAQIPKGQQTLIIRSWLIPFENILEIDPMGDNIFPIPHLYCSFYGENGPYSGNFRYLNQGTYGGLEYLDSENRAELFQKP